MRIAILADIHANARALMAVHEDAAGRGVETFWVLGDVIGYGPHPDICIHWLQEVVADNHWVLGNHEAIYASLLPADEMNQVSDTARIALELNRKMISADTQINAFCVQNFISQRCRPVVLEHNERQHILVHSGQVDNLLRYVYPWNKEIYLPAEFTALQALAGRNSRGVVQWYGHTHVPAFIRARPDEKGQYAMAGIEAEQIVPGEIYQLDGRHTLINPGSVGQPRDGNQCAAYALLDTAKNTVVFHRVAYDWHRTVEDLKHQGYPEQLVARLRDAPLSKDAPPAWKEHYDRVSKRLDCNGIWQTV